MTDLPDFTDFADLSDETLSEYALWGRARFGGRPIGTDGRAVRKGVVAPG